MMYPFVTLNDQTEITHSHVLEGGKVEVYIETPDEKDGFHNARCVLPDFLWTERAGYTDAEMEYFSDWVRSTASLILDLAYEESAENAANL